MFTTLHCIALRSVKHSDSKSILSAWSRELGRISIAMPEGCSREARRRRALTMPLGLFEGECDLRPGRDILSMRDVKPSGTLPGGTMNPAKTAGAMFLADVLDALLRHSPADEHLSIFLFDAMDTFASENRPAAICNFHIVFLYRLMHFLGIEPHMGSWREGAYFDLREGRFSLTMPLHDFYLSDDGVAAMRLLARLNYRTMHLARFSREDRNRILDTLLDYYTAHLVRLDSLKSLQVLRSLF